jgi:hypothetical protein
VHTLAADPFFDVAQRVQELALDRVEFLGRWGERNPWNVPGPFYVGDDDACGTGPANAPNNVILVVQVDEPFLGQSDFGGEFLYRQPTSNFELRQVIDAADVNVMSAYGLDGNLHLNHQRVVDWWRRMREVRSVLRENVGAWRKEQMSGTALSAGRRYPSADLWRFTVSSTTASSGTCANIATF